MTGVNGPASVDGGGHALAPASCLTGTTAKQTEGADILAGVTIDQLIARHIGQDTAVPVARGGDGGLQRIRRRVRRSASAAPT